jgi:serine/threonine protein kinase
MNQRLIGQLIGNRYRLTHHISEGGYGNVFEAVDTQLNDEPVAVKLLRPPPPDMEPEYYQQLQQRFLDEARVSALLGEHPNIVQVRSYGLYQNQPYLVMEYLKAKPYTGQGLDYVLAREGPLHPERVVNLALQICSALHHAHNFHMDLGKHSIRGVIHRDIKPSNIFVQKGPDGKERVKLLDFGISKLMGETSRGLTQTGYFLGTMVYASPEQMRGEKLDGRSDIYSLGVVLYELLTGALPFEPETDTLQGWYHVHNFQKPRPFQDHPLPHPIPEALEKVVLRCLEKDPALRPATMEELAQQLRAVYGDKIPPPPQKAPLQRIPAGFGQQATQQSRAAPVSEAEEEELQRAVRLIEAGEYKMAVHLLNKLIQSAPNEARYYLYRGLAHQRQGHWGLAQMDYQGVLRLEPGNPSAEQGLREVEQQVGQEQVSPHQAPPLQIQRHRCRPHLPNHKPQQRHEPQQGSGHSAQGLGRSQQQPGQASKARQAEERRKRRGSPPKTKGQRLQQGRQAYPSQEACQQRQHHARQVYPETTHSLENVQQRHHPKSLPENRLLPQRAKGGLRQKPSAVNVIQQRVEHGRQKVGLPSYPSPTTRGLLQSQANADPVLGKALMST